MPTRVRFVRGVPTLFYCRSSLIREHTGFAISVALTTLLSSRATDEWTSYRCCTHNYTTTALLGQTILSYIYPRLKLSALRSTTRPGHYGNSFDGSTGELLRRPQSSGQAGKSPVRIPVCAALCQGAYQRLLHFFHLWDNVLSSGSSVIFGFLITLRPCAMSAKSAFPFARADSIVYRITDSPRCMHAVDYVINLSLPLLRMSSTCATKFKFQLEKLAL